MLSDKQIYALTSIEIYGMLTNMFVENNFLTIEREYLYENYCLALA